MTAVAEMPHIKKSSMQDSSQHEVGSAKHSLTGGPELDKTVDPTGGSIMSPQMIQAVTILSQTDSDLGASRAL